MPDFIIETSYHLPMYRRRPYSAETMEQACIFALGDEGWDGAREAVDDSGETYVSGVWQGKTVYDRAKGRAVRRPRRAPAEAGAADGHLGARFQEVVAACHGDPGESRGDPCG